MKFRILFVIIMTTLMVSLSVSAQEETVEDMAQMLSGKLCCPTMEEKPIYRNIYLELFGASNLIGISYDSRIKPGSPFGYRAGISYIYGSRTTYYNTDDAHGIGIPMAFNCILGKRKSKFEVSLGINMGFYSMEEHIFYDQDGQPTIFNPVYMTKKTHHLFGYYIFSDIGYRYQRKSGFMLRVGVNPSFSFGGRHGVKKTPLLFPYLSLGYTL